MADLVIRSDSGDRRFDSDATARVTIGRSPACDIVVSDQRVSRDPHAEITWDGVNWVLSDRSTRGTFLDGEPVQSRVVGRSDRLTLGAADGPVVLVHSSAALVEAAPAPPPPQPPPPAEPLRWVEQVGVQAPPPTPPTPATPPEPVPAAPPIAPAASIADPIRPVAPPPYGAFGPDANETIVVSDRGLTLRVNDDERYYPPDRGQVTVGRDERADIHLTSRLVSRAHARFVSSPTGWFLEDLGSERGTFVDGQRIVRPTPMAGDLVVTVGGEDGGIEIAVSTAGVHQKPRGKGSKAPLVIGVIAAVALIAAGLAVILATRSDDQPVASSTPTGPVGPVSGAPNTPEQLTQAKLATVKIFAVDRRGKPIYSGTGSFISSDVILTNAHVGKPSAPIVTSLDPDAEEQEDPAGFVIAVSTKEDAPAEPALTAEFLAVSDTQDAALLKVSGKVEDSQVDASTIPTVELGFDEVVKAGDEFQVLGYPGNSGSESISVVTAQVKNIVSPEEAEKQGLGRRKLLESSEALLGHGASGGPLLRHGKVIGLVQLGFEDMTGGNTGLTIGLNVPITEIRDLIEQNIDR